MPALVMDLANLITHFGLFCGVVGICLAVRGDFSAAMIAMLLALLCDWFDGPFARRTKGRTPELRAFGAQLDSLVDSVCAGLFPAIVLMSYAHFSLWAFPGAFLLAGAGVVRLSYFNVFQAEGEPAYVGLTIDNNIIAITLLFLLEGVVSQQLFTGLLYTAVVVLAVLNVSSFRMPKPGRPWFYVITLYAVGMMCVYSWRLF